MTRERWMDIKRAREIQMGIISMLFIVRLTQQCDVKLYTINVATCFNPLESSSGL